MRIDKITAPARLKSMDQASVDGKDEWVDGMAWFGNRRIAIERCPEKH